LLPYQRRGWSGLGAPQGYAFAIGAWRRLCWLMHRKVLNTEDTRGPRRKEEWRFARNPAAILLGDDPDKLVRALQERFPRGERRHILLGREASQNK
jgi:hypothetical protein